jgi:hypothetical protein
VVDVPVPANSPAAAGATPVIVPAPGPGWGPPAVAPATPAALPPAPVIPALPPRIVSPGPYRQPQRSLADMANEQLRRGKPKDPLAEGMQDASRDDCLHAPQKEGSATGLLNAPSVIGRALSGTCAK